MRMQMALVVLPIQTITTQQIVVNLNLALHRKWNQNNCLFLNLTDLVPK